MGLFDTLARPRGRRDTVAEQVLRNLENVLNSKRGWSSPLRDFGVRSFTEYVSREHLTRAIADEISECIERYEPRLRLDAIEVVETAEQSRLSFAIRCTLLDGMQMLRVEVNPMVGTFSVSQ